MVVGMLDICEKKEACEECLACKQHILSFDEGKACGTKGVLELVLGDIFDPMRTTSVAGAKYFLLLVDDFSRKMWIYFLKINMILLPSLKSLR